MNMPRGRETRWVNYNSQGKEKHTEMDRVRETQKAKQPQMELLIKAEKIKALRLSGSTIEH